MIYRRSTFLLIPALLLLVASCTSPLPQTSLPGETSDSIEQLQAQSTPPVPPQTLSNSVIFDTLTAEIAAQRGDHQTAYTHAIRAAHASRAPSAAERATQLALQAKLTPEAMQATRLWLELDPNSLGANQIAALLTANQKQLTETVHHLNEVVRIANEQGQNGYLKAAAIAEKAGTPDQSLALMQQVIPADSENPDALHALALSAMQARQFPLAQQSIDRALQARPDWPKGMLLLSRSLIAQNKPLEGLEILKGAISKAPDNTELRLSYARLLLDNNQLEASLEQFEVLNQQNPTNQDIIFALGVISSELKHYDSASEYFQRLVKTRKRRDDAHFQLGLITQRQDNLEEALYHFSKVGGNNQVDARIQMARILAGTGKLNQARELLQHLRFIVPQQDVRLHLIEADLLRDAREYAVAHEVYNRGLELYQENIDLLYARALNAADMGHLNILEQDLNKILNHQPDHADALNALGYTLADQTGRLDEAKQYIQKALSLKPDSPAILDSMGWVEFRLGNLEGALKFLQEAAKFSPDAEIASHLGEVLWHMNKKQQALEVWQKANELEPDNRFIKPVMQRLGAE
ncbi:MAG: tetratricopeptide repeat protein [Gammaproteobacteria bacterium]|nr:tetratricopeptide repeat protein [Gammaproteobacteria bacterium]